MEKFSSDQIDRICHLSRLNLSAEEKQRFLGDIGNILTYVEKLNNIDLKDVVELSHSTDLKNVMRDDAGKQSLPQELVFKNSPQTERNHFKVPKIIE